MDTSIVLIDCTMLLLIETVGVTLCDMRVILKVKIVATGGQLSSSHMKRYVDFRMR